MKCLTCQREAMQGDCYCYRCRVKAGLRIKAHEAGLARMKSLRFVKDPKKLARWHQQTLEHLPIEEGLRVLYKPYYTW